MDYTSFIPDHVSLYIFDLDGTLIDSLEDLFLSVNWILREYGYPDIDRETVRRGVGNGAKNLLARSFHASANSGLSAKRGLTPDKLEEALVLYREHYNANCTQHTRLYDGIPEWLDNLSLRGCKMAVLTNKPEFASRELLQSLGVLRSFEIVAGPETFNALKPDPAGIYGILKLTGISAEQTVMIGDSIVDVQTARNSGVLACGITGGLGDDDELIASGPDILIKRG
jgi:phosphoglycolate phosphatase